MPKRLSKTQRRLLCEAIASVNSEDVRDCMAALEIIEPYPWLLDWPIWSAGENMPGYMPDSPYMLFHTERGARGYCRSLERGAGGRDYVSDMIPVTLREVL